MKLVSVIHGPAYGGAHNQLVRLARPLAAHGVETVALLPDEAANAANRIRQSGIETITIPLRRLRASLDPLEQARFLRFLAHDIGAIGDAIGDLEADLVQVHGPTNPQAAIAGRRTGKVAVVWQLLDTRAPMGARRLTMPVVTRLADAITSWGQAVAREHPGAERLGERLVTVFPPVDAGAFAPGTARVTAARARLDVSAEAITIGTVGVLNPQKGHEHLIAAAGVLARGSDRVALRILGAPSPAHAVYGGRLREDVRRLGLGDPAEVIRDPGEEVADLIQGLDVFALASVRRSEGMPTAILEAMVAGKPVVATKVGAVDELVEDGVSGLLVEPEQPEALAEALRALIDDPSLRRSMGEAGRRIAAERFDLETLAQRHLRAYDLAIEHRGRRGASRPRRSGARRGHRVP